MAWKEGEKLGDSSFGASLLCGREQVHVLHLLRDEDDENANIHGGSHKKADEFSIA